MTVLYTLCTQNVYKFLIQVIDIVFIMCYISMSIKMIKQILIFLIITLLTFSACTSPAEVIIDTEAIDSLQTENDSLKSKIDSLLLNIETLGNYDFAPGVGVISINNNSKLWNAIILGKFVNNGPDTLRNVGIRFTIKDLISDTIITEIIGFYTKQTTFFEYHQAEYPYTKEINIAPNEKYWFYAATDTIRDIFPWDVTWWTNPIVPLP